MSGIEERIREASELVGGLKALAKATDIPRRTIGNWLIGTRPKPEGLQKIAEVTGVNLNWLITGDGPKIAKPEMVGVQNLLESQGLREEKLRLISSPEVAHLPLFDIRASAGPGGFAFSGDPQSELTLGLDLLDSLGLRPNGLAMLWARGDSMFPTIPDGSLLLVDVNDTNPRSGQIYVAQLDDDLFVKRLQNDPSGVTLISDADGPQYPPIRISRNHLKRLHIHGRVVYVMRAV